MRWSAWIIATWSSFIGNILAAGGHGLAFNSLCGSTLIMNNDFASVTYRGIGLGEFGGVVQSAIIVNNIIGRGSTFNVQLPPANSFGWFLYQNQYLNGSGQSVPPFMDPAGSAVHVTP